MKIVVCVKQVPDTAQLKFDAQDNLLLDSAEKVLNPCCSYAVETALQLKEANEGSTVTAISIGPATAKEALKRAIAMGCDDAHHLSDPAFEKLDSWQIANLLAEAVKKLVPDYNLLLIGQYSDDSMRGTTGAMLAEVLAAPSITLGSKVTLSDPSKARVERQTELGLEIHEMTLPGVVAMANSTVEPRIPSIKGVMRANRTEIPVVDAAAVGSPTHAAVQTMTIFRKPQKSGGTKIDGAEAPVAVEQLVAYLKEQKVL